MSKGSTCQAFVNDVASLVLTLRGFSVVVEKTNSNDAYTICIFQNDVSFATCIVNEDFPEQTVFYDAPWSHFATIRDNDAKSFLNKVFSRSKILISPLNCEIVRFNRVFGRFLPNSSSLLRIEYKVRIDSFVDIKLRVPVSDQQALRWKLDPGTYFTVDFVADFSGPSVQFWSVIYSSIVVTISSTDETYRLAPQLQNILKTWLPASLERNFQFEPLAHAVPVGGNVCHVNLATSDKMIDDEMKEDCRDDAMTTQQTPTSFSKCDDFLSETKISHVIETAAKSMSESFGNCPICQTRVVDGDLESDDEQQVALLIPCHHAYHVECLRNLAEFNVKNGQKGIDCCVCGKRYGDVRTGSQPENGCMSFVFKPTVKVPGYAESDGCIEIRYSFPAGFSANAGQAYSAKDWIAYLPANSEGKLALELLKIAFERRLVFRLGASSTTGMFGICWAIHHKTMLSGSAYAYPDDTYLSRLLAELALVGITPDLVCDNNAVVMASSSASEEELIEKKSSPPLDESGIFGAISAYVSKRLDSLNLFCVVCDTPHTIQPRLPVPCAKPLCIFGFSELGLSRNVGYEMAFGYDILHLLLTLAYHAARSTRHIDLLRPFPTMLQMPNETEGAVAMNVQTAIARFPSVESLIEECTEEELPMKKFAERVHRWVMLSNIATIHPLRSSASCRELEHLFGAKSILFFSRKEHDDNLISPGAATTTMFAFHGSPRENWHSILRSRLVVGTSKNRLLIHGNAYGTGIYLSPRLSVSSEYARNNATQEATSDSSNRWFGFGKNSLDRCVAVCEVDKSHATHAHTDIFVVADETKVVIRFLLLYTNETHPVKPVVTTEANVEKLIHQVLQDMR